MCIAVSCVCLCVSVCSMHVSVILHVYVKGPKKKWDTANSVEEKWDVLSSVMCDAVKEWLGSEDIQPPGWFWESEVDLKPLFAERSRMHAVWLSNGRGTSSQSRDGLGLEGG